MLDEQPALYPYRTAPKRIADDLVAALAAAPGVAAVWLFGSLASEEWDGLSDIDLLVAWEGATAPEQAAEAGIAVLNLATPVRYIRRFSDPARRRLWFWGESPFHWLDISFHDRAEYDAMRRDGVREGHPVASQEAFRRSGGAHDPARPEPVEGRAGGAGTSYGEAVAARFEGTPPGLDISERERAAAKAVYWMLRHTKQYLRARIDRAAYDEAYREFLAAAVLRADGTFAGGDLAGLVQECFALRFAIDREERGG